MKKYLHKNIIRGFSVALTVCLFLRGVVWAAPSAGQVFKQNLAAESIFQNDMMSFSSIVPREEKVSDIDIFLSVLEIGKNLLPDPSQKETYIPLEYLEYVLRSEHEICGHVMPGLDLSRVNYYPGDSNIVLVPYKKEEQNNVMQIARRPLFLRNKMIGEEVNVSDKFDAKNFRGTYSEFLELVEKKEDDQIKEIHKELVEEPKKEGFLSFSQGTESGIRKPLFAGGKLNATVPVMVTHGINSMEQLIDALDFAATVVEVDVQMTSDGVFVAVWGEIDDGESRKCVYELTARELEKIMGKKLLRIEDVFKKVKGRCAVNLDIKDWSDRVPGYKTAMLDKMIDLIKQNGMEEDILASSFNSDFVSYLKTMLPSISVCIPVDRSFDVGSGLDIIMERVKKIGADTIILYLEQINKDVIEGIHAAGVRVAVNAVENSLSELPDRLIRECDFVYTEDVPVSSEQRQVSSKNILDMTHDEIFELMDPKYMEVRKHSLVAWEYAKVIARRLGHTDDEFLNMLRVICFAHDIGGVMGYPPDDKIDRKLLRIAREKGISYKNKDPEEVIKAFEKNGEILTEQEKKLVYSMDHPNNSLRLLDKNNIYVPKEVRFVISRHMDQITLKELRNLSGKERMLLKIFLVSDILECGNNPYKQVQRGRSETEDHNVTITFFLGWQTKSQVSMQDVVNAVECAEKAGEFKRAKTLSGSPVAEIPELFLGLKERELFMELKDGMEQLLEYGNRNKLELIFRQIAAFTRKDARYEKIKNAILRLSREYVIWTDNLSGEIEKVKEQLPLDEKKNLEILFADIRQSVKAKKDEQWAIVQAGGAGTRIWPKGDENLPKQLLEIERGKGSLLTQTILRNINENDPNSIYPSQIVIMTSERLEDKVWEDVKGLGILRKNIISQPENLDTGPALRIGALFIENKGGADAVIRVVNSDCIIQDCLKFNEAISRASDFAKLTNVVAEIGITPAKKANGEYIVNPKLGHQVLGIKIGEGIYSLLNRIEKEEKETCEETDKFYRELVEAGAKWNSGIIVVRAGVLSEMMREINPELENIFQRYKTDIIERRNLGGLFQDIRKLKVLISSQLPWEKKDKGHIGSSDRMLSVPLTEQKNPYFDIVCVTGVESDDWSDVGNLIELRNMAKVPEKMNFVAMGNEDDIIFEKGSFGNTVHASGDGTKIYIHRGVKNIIVAHEARNNALLLLPSRNYARVGDVPRRIKENPELKHLFPYVTGKNVPENVFVNEKKSDHRGNIIAGDAVFLEDTTDSCFFTNKGLIAAIDMHRYTVIWDENFREIHIYASEIPELIDKNIQAYKFSEKNREIFRRGKDFFVLQGTLREKLESVVSYQKNRTDFKIPPKLGDGSDYWDWSQGMVLRSESGKGRLYKILNKGRDIAFRVPPERSPLECILCANCRDQNDRGIIIDEEWEAKANMFPIFDGDHGTLIHRDHMRQKLRNGDLIKILKWTDESEGFRFLHNGRNAGATTRNHLHIQFFKSLKPFDVFIGDVLPVERYIENDNNLTQPISVTEGVTTRLLKGYPSQKDPIAVFLVKGESSRQSVMAKEIERIIHTLESQRLDYNIYWYKKEGEINTLIFPRVNSGIASEADTETWIAKSDRSYLLSRDSISGRRSKMRVFATIEFMGVFVGGDKEQYQQVTYDDMVTLLNKLGLSLIDGRYLKIIDKLKSENVPESELGGAEFSQIPANNIRDEIIESGNEIISNLRAMWDTGFYGIKMGRIKDLSREMGSVEIKETIESVVAEVEKIGKGNVPTHINMVVKRMNKRLQEFEIHSIVGALIVLARRAKKENRKLIIGLETGWVPGYKKKGLQYSLLSPIISEIKAFKYKFKAMGLDNIVIVENDGEALARDILSEMDKKLNNLSNVIILASRDTIGLPKFEQFRTTETDKKAFLAAVDTSRIKTYYDENDNDESILRQINVEILMMLTITLELALGKKASDLPIIWEYKDSSRYVLFFPDAKPIDYEEMIDLNMASKIALQSV